MRRAAESGYALVAAVASIAVFAAIALTVQTMARTALLATTAEQGALHAGAAADAGIAIALEGLLADADRWAIDGRRYDRRFGAARLRIRIEDERGKVPVNHLTEPQVTRLLGTAGLADDRLRIARDSLLDWIDEDGVKRPFGAEAAEYRASLLEPPNGFLAAVDELGSVRGFDHTVVERLRPFVTVESGAASFDPRYADPRAIAVMTEGGADSPAAIDRLREQAGQRTALSLAASQRIDARPLTIAVEASLPGGARAERRAVVQLTGAPSRPYVVRSFE